MSAKTESFKSTKLKKKTGETKNKLKLRQSIEADMSSDDESSIVSSIPPELHDIYSNPSKKVPQGETHITTLVAVSKQYDIDLETLFTSLNPNCSVEEFKKEIKAKLKKEKKKELIKEAKFIPLDKTGKKMKVPRVNDLYRVKCYENITEEDKLNEEYFKNDKFNKLIYFNKKWSSISKKEKKKYEIQVDKLREAYNKEYEKQKPEEKPKAPPNSYILFSSDIRKKIKENPELSSKKPTEITAYIASEWSKASQKTKEKYSKKSLKLKEEYKEKLIEFEKRQIELKKKEEKEFNSQTSSNNEAGPVEGTSDSENTEDEEQEEQVENKAEENNYNAETDNGSDNNSDDDDDDTDTDEDSD